MPVIGNVWASDTWDVDAWEADTWANESLDEVIAEGDIFTATVSIRQHNLSTQFIKQTLVETVQR